MQNTKALGKICITRKSWPFSYYYTNFPLGFCIFSINLSYLDCLVINFSLHIIKLQSIIYFHIYIYVYVVRWVKCHLKKITFDISVYYIYLPKLHENILKYYWLNLFEGITIDFFMLFRWLWNPLKFFLQSPYLNC